MREIGIPQRLEKAGEGPFQNPGRSAPLLNQFIGCSQIGAYVQSTSPATEMTYPKLRSASAMLSSAQTGLEDGALSTSAVRSSRRSQCGKRIRQGRRRMERQGGCVP